MDSAERIKRINELARLAKQRSLTPDEKQEQAELRAQYIEEFRNRFRSQLEGIEILEEDGSITKPKRRGSKLH
jgi:uncharacterized protein YnzC (UPF0291/DUF896 family)